MNWKSLRRLFFEDTDGNLSHTKMWSNVGYAELAIMFPYTVMCGDKAGEIVWLIFAGVVIGNRSINKLIEARVGAKQQ